MNEKHQMEGRRKRTRWLAAGAAVIALAGGGYAMTGASSSPSTSASTATTAPAATAAPAATGAATPTTAGKVIPFQAGTPGASKVVGQVPASYKAGAGTIVTGTAADKAKAAAVAAYPGGTVNRVVLLSSGDYNVHVIGVNWPHHVFVNKSFVVIGAS